MAIWHSIVGGNDAVTQLNESLPGGNNLQMIGVLIGMVLLTTQSYC